MQLVSTLLRGIAEIADVRHITGSLRWFVDIPAQTVMRYGVTRDKTVINVSMFCVAHKKLCLFFAVTGRRRSAESLTISR